MMKLIYKEQGTGIICAIDKDKIWVLTNIGDSSCAAKKKECKVGCGTCSTRKTERRFSITIENPDQYIIGDSINFSRFVPEPNLISFLVFGTPIFFALITIVCWLLAAPQKIESGPALLSTAAAFFSAFFILMIIDTLFKKRYPATVINDKNIDNTKICSAQFTDEITLKGAVNEY
ncbi:MAG: SoxR reducing system RseC family protein [Chitinispirillia bacterium]|nr:SoxR reducing system RseC family protein [Chitinispirillia bacterium]